MAYYSIFPEKDSTIYSNPDRDTLNTGNDEILELVKEKGINNGIYYPSRILIQFKDSDINNIISNKIPNDFSASLQLFSSEHTNLSQNQEVEVFAISQSWDEGTGRYSNLPISSNGCSWLYRDNSTSKNKWPSSSFAVDTTGSIDPNTGIGAGGGVWFTGSNFVNSQSFLRENNLDLNINVTSIIHKFSASIFSSQTYPTGIPNNGFLLKYPNRIEENTSGSRGTLSYFSVDTHTIFPPKLTFKWDDSIHNSQSLAKNKGELNVSLYRNKEEYNINEESIFRLNVRDKYPDRTFSTTSNYLNVGYFTTSSYYSIRDAHTEEEIIPFDNEFTKLSADSEGMYFKIYMKGLQPERYYRLLFKHINNDGIEIFDNNYHFKVVR
jgi:hypothetical protein|tara:strand:- start:5 stop:1144 length:1140 start_codon:yes stop_codon:yes gene_type:complete